MKREKTFMNWLDDTVREWDLEPEVEEEFNRLMLHQRIADLRERAGLTQAELAKRTGVSQPMIAKLESGRADNLTLRIFIRYALALGYAPRVDFVPVHNAKARRPHQKSMSAPAEVMELRGALSPQASRRLRAATARIRRSWR